MKGLKAEKPECIEMYELVFILFFKLWAFPNFAARQAAIRVCVSLLYLRYIGKQSRKAHTGGSPFVAQQTN